MNQEALFERAQNGELSQPEQEQFNQRCQNDPAFNSEWQSYKYFFESLQYWNQKSKFIEQYQRETKKAPVGPIYSTKKRLLAATLIILISVFSTIAILRFSGLFLHSNSSEITYLNRKVDKIDQHQQDAKSTEALKKRKALSVNAHSEGSAFAINNQGYLLTSYHLINGYKEMFISNDQFERLTVKLEYAHPETDLAVLRIEDSLAYSKWNIPYILRNGNAALGEDVFTLGYPRKDVVYGSGVLSSRTGFDEDSTLYQVSIPVNPGNSGGPVFDGTGQLIGMIKGKNISAEGESFAVKSCTIKKTLTDWNINKSKTPPIHKLGRLNRPLQLKKINPYIFNLVVFKK